jgi:NAD(P)H-dependent flavin oxidoreductase YrpB (nitropropane dioxygenase family)
MSRWAACAAVHPVHPAQSLAGLEAAAALLRLPSAKASCVTSVPLDVGGLSRPRHRDLRYGPLEIVLALRETGLGAGHGGAYDIQSRSVHANWRLAAARSGDHHAQSPHSARQLALPVIGAPLFIVSGPELVIAQCKAGIVGAFPALNARPKELLEEWILRTKSELAAYEKAAEQGVDGLILVCAGAGGHAGMLSPFALLPEVRRFFKGTIALSGAIATGDGILAAQALGADLAYLGTRFIATREANAKDDYKAMIVGSAAADIVYTNLFTGVHGNYLKASLAAAGLDPDNLPVADKTKMNFGSGGNMKVKAWRDVWGSGQGVGSIDDVPAVAELVARLEGEYRTAVGELDAVRFGAPGFARAAS